MDLMPKRVKRTGVPLSSKEKKEKVSERISALQQLVSPYGKTDTASVLLEAMEYISFLHEQVKEKKEKVSERISALQQLVSPYGKTDTASVLLEAMEYISFLHEQVKDDETSTLKAKGLCLVPISFTVGVASSNGADIWAPIKTGLSNSRQLVVDEASVITQG
ncbi:UNVERIFIED_CONTAM: Transcription factor [Sesamum radiatum]|uniref:Transcription factor n=1 Tax=Sesamum radiatum TaxID=300843 RepID=A0AAW2SJ34_SESRA